MKARDAVPAAAVFVFALAYLLLLRPYGFQLEDEGTLLFWFDRASRGQQPYLDFHTGYTPGFFVFGKAVFAAFGPSATAVRTVLAVINAATAAGLAEAGRRVAGRSFAAIAPLLWLAFVPLYAGEFAAFNIPYPTWPVTLAWAALALVLLSWTHKPRPMLLSAAGVLAAATMWLRPNSGAFALAAATWVIVATASRRSAADRVAAWGASLFMALGVLYTFQFRVVGMDAFVHLPPTAAVALLCAGPLAAKLRDEKAPRALASLAGLGAAFALPTLAWTLPLLGSLGLSRFLYEVFLVGADYQSLYYKPHPAPEPYAVAVVAALFAFAGGGRLVATGRARPAALAIAALFAGLAATLLVAVLGGGVAPEGVVASVVAQLENASYWLALTANFAALGWLWRVTAKEGALSPTSRALAVTIPLAIAMYLQMYPRSDFMHQVTAVPLTAVVACGLLGRVSAWWAGGEWPEGWRGRRFVKGAVLAAAGAVLAVAFSGKISGPVEAWSNRPPPIAMPPRLAVHVEDAAGDEVAAIASTVAFLRGHTSEGEAAWSFPATSGLLFAASLTNAAPHDYWYPGRPDHEEESRVLEGLRRARPRYIVTLGRGWNFFAGAPGYFSVLRSFVTENYRLAARYGRYDVLGRRDLGDAPVATFPASKGAVAMESVLEGNLERRRQAAARWMEALTPAQAAAASLPPGRRDALLLLRALRDGGDLRGAGWAIVGGESPDARIRAEAGDAMVALAEAFSAARVRLADDYDLTALRPFVSPWAGRARALGGDKRLAPFVAAVTGLADGGGEGPFPR